VHIRPARGEDLESIVALLADDSLGRLRERPGDPAYAAAFTEITADPRQILAVAEQADEVVGTAQLTFIPGLSRLGMTRAQVEAVRVRSDQRGQGVGRAMLEWAIATARHRGAGLVQLTTDASRKEAHRFYENLGFRPSHLGMKLDLTENE
jgi:GNAT superfamily N-acetyltransferase